MRLHTSLARCLRVPQVVLALDYLVESHLGSTTEEEKKQYTEEEVNELSGTVLFVVQLTRDGHCLKRALSISPGQPPAIAGRTGDLLATITTTRCSAVARAMPLWFTRRLDTGATCSSCFQPNWILRMRWRLGQSLLMGILILGSSWHASE